MVRKRKPNASITYSCSDALMQAVFLGILTLLCFSASMRMMQDVFPEWVISREAQTWILGLAVFTAVFYEVFIRALPRFHACCGLLLAGLYGAVIYRYAASRQVDLEDGACAFAVQFLEKYNKHLKTSYTIWEGKRELLGMSLALLMLVVVLALLLIALMIRKRVVLLICPLVVLSGELLVGFVPQWHGLALFFAAILFMSAGEQPAGRYGRRMLRMRMDGQRRKMGTLLLRWLPPMVLAAAAVLVPAVGTAFFEAPAERMMEKNPQVREFQQKIERDIAGFAAFFSDPQEEDINNDSRNYTGREVMKITAASRPSGDIFLKGFCGTDYENGRWVCRQEEFADACEQAGYTQEAAARELLQAEYDRFISAAAAGNAQKGAARELLRAENDRSISAAADEQEADALAGQDGGQDTERASAGDNGQGADRDGGMTDFTIEYTGIRGRNAYLPYILDLSGSGSGGRVQLSGDTVLRKPWGLSHMTVRAWGQEISAQVFAPELQISMVPSVDLRQYRTLDSTDVQGPFQWYQTFVYDTYLDVPDSLQFPEDIVQWMPHRRQYEMDDQLEYYGWDAVYYRYIHWNMAEYVKLLLDWYMDYNLELDAVPEGMDTLDYFFQESREGYCVHFASAAVLLLRSMGVPARYVSGYVAKQNEFRPSDSGYTAIVRDRHAHAWAEVYIDDIGWVPIDVTPSDGQETSAAAPAANTQADKETGADQDTKADEETKADDKTKADQDTQTDSDTQPGKKGETNGSIPLRKWILTILAVTGLLLLCGSLLFVLQRAVRTYQELPVKDLKSGRYRSTVIRLNRRIYRRLFLRGKLRLHGMCDADYEMVLISAYPDVSEPDWKHYMCAVREAAFSGQELQEADAYFCYRLYRRLRGRK